MRRLLALLILASAIAAVAGCGGDSSATKALHAQSAANAEVTAAHSNVEWTTARADLTAYCVIHPSGDQGADGVAAVDAVAKMIGIAKRAPDDPAPGGGTYRSGLTDQATYLLRCDAELSAYAQLALRTLDP